MRRYFFHVINGEVIHDLEAQECSDLDEARNHAVIGAGEMLRDQGLKVWKTRNYYMFVADENNLPKGGFPGRGSDGGPEITLVRTRRRSNNISISVLELGSPPAGPATSSGHLAFIQRRIEATEPCGRFSSSPRRAITSSVP